MDGLSPPPQLLDAYGAWSWTLAWDNAPNIRTWSLDGPDGQHIYLKVARHRYPSIADEAERMRWAGQFLPVPRVIESGSNTDVAWLVTRAMPGMNAVTPPLLADPATLVPILARGLLRFHSAPMQACPFDFRVDRALDHVRRRLVTGAVDVENDLHPEHRHLGLNELLPELERLRPRSEDLVVCHGDYCLPNVLIEGDQVTSFVDLGGRGVADRWWDLAVATWSVTWNVGPGWEGAFLDAYGIERDDARIEFYRLLYDLVS